jgi:hypothetical protein
VRRASTREISVAKTKCQPKLAQSNHPKADSEADEERRSRLYTGKSEEKEDRQVKSQ